jgi:arylsulfatase A-like enzyme
MGDAFFRWDAFKYYGSFSEFLPGVALISILWCFISLLSALFIWQLLRILQWLSRSLKLRVSTEQLLSCLGLFVLFGGIVWKGKRFLWPALQTSLYDKLGILTTVALISIFLTWIFRRKVDQWIEIVHGRITPLVWLFGMTVIVSIPLVSYLALSTENEHAVFENNVEYSEEDENRPNIILVTFDALTARDMSVYGFDKETTPFISEWAKSATVFTRHEAAANYTSSTTASLMTGKRVWTHRRFQSHAGAPVKSDTESLPLLLKNNGYYNMAFVTNSIASVQELGMVDSFMVASLSNEFIEPASLYGFLGYHLYKLFSTRIKMYYWIIDEDFILYKLTPDNYVKYPKKTEFPVEKAFDSFVTEIDNNPPEPYFAWIHVFPPHAPYLPPEQYSGLFESSPKYREWKSQYPLVRKRYFKKDKQSDANIVRSRYDEFIRYCDRQFQGFIEELGEKGQLKNTIIILSSDHGESFEHGYFTHGGPFLYEQMTHLPLIIKEPGQVEGKIIDTIVDQVDIPVTILDMGGISIPSWMEGRSLVPLLRGKDIEPKPAFSMNFDKNPASEKITKGTIAVWEGDYKLIHYLEKKESLLFNLREDPDELNNLIEKKPEVGQRLLGLIQHRLKEVNGKFVGEDY